MLVNAVKLIHLHSKIDLEMLTVLFFREMFMNPVLGVPESSK